MAEGPKTEEYEFTDDDLAKDNSWRPPVPPVIDSEEEYADYAEILEDYKEIINSAQLHDGIFETRLPTGAKKLEIDDKVDIDFEAANTAFLTHLTKTINEIGDSDLFKEKLHTADGKTSLSASLAAARKETQDKLTAAKVTDPLYKQLADFKTVQQFVQQHAETLNKYSRNDTIIQLRTIADQSQAAIAMNTGAIDMMRLTSPENMPQIRKFLNEHVDALKITPLEEDENFNHPRFLAALTKLDDKEQKEFQNKFKINVPLALGKIGEQLGVLAEDSPDPLQSVALMEGVINQEIAQMTMLELNAFLNTHKGAIGIAADLPLDAKPDSKIFLSAYGKALEYYSQQPLPKDKDGKEDETFKAQKAAFGALNESLPPIDVYPDPKTGNPVPLHLAHVAAPYYGLTKLFPGREDLPMGVESIPAFAIADYQNKLLQFKAFYGFQPFEIGFTPDSLKNPLFLDAYNLATTHAAAGITASKDRIAKFEFTPDEKTVIEAQFETKLEDMKASVAKLGTAAANAQDVNIASILVIAAAKFKKIDVGATGKDEDKILLDHATTIWHVAQSAPSVRTGITAALNARAPKPSTGTPAPEGSQTTPQQDTTGGQSSTTPTVTQPLVEANPEQAKAVIIYGQKALGLKEGAKIGDTEFKLENWGKLAGTIGTPERAADPTILALKKRFIAEYENNKGTVRIPAQSKAGFKPEDASAEDMMLFFEALYQRRLDTYDQNVERYALLESKHETAVEDNKKFETTLRDKLSYISPALQDEVLESLKTGELSKARTKEQIAKTEFYKKLRKDAGENKAGSVDDDLWVLLLQIREINDNLTPPNIKEGLGRSIEASKLNLEQLHGMVGFSTYNATGKIPPSLIFDDPENVRGPGEYAEQEFDDRLFDPAVYTQLRNTKQASMALLAYDPAIKKIIDFLEYTKKESLTTEEVGKIAQIRMLEVAKLYGVENASDLSAAIFNGTYVPYQGDPEIRIMGDLELVHAGFGKPPRDQIPADYIKLMTDAGLDPYDELNLQGVIARYRNGKFNELYGKPDEAHALRYGHRIGYFRGLDIPKGQSVAEIRATLKGDDLTLFNDYIQSLQKVSAFIYFDMLPKEYNDLRWGKYRDKTLEIFNGKAPEPEKKPAPEVEKKAEATPAPATKPALTKEEAAAALPRSKFAEDNSSNLTGAAKKFYILASGFNEQAPKTDNLRLPLYYLKDLDGFLTFMQTASEDQIANVFDLDAKNTGIYGPDHNPKLVGMAQNQMIATAFAWAAMAGDSAKVAQVREAVTSFSPDKYKYDAVQIIGRAPLSVMDFTFKEVSINNPDQLFAHYKLWKDHVFKNMDTAPLKEKLETTGKLGDDNIYVTFLGSLAAAKNTGKPENLQTALREWEKIAKDAGLPFDKMLMSASPYLSESGSHRDKDGADNLSHKLDENQAGKIKEARLSGADVTMPPAHVIPTGAPAPTYDPHHPAAG